MRLVREHGSGHFELRSAELLYIETVRTGGQARAGESQLMVAQVGFRGEADFNLNGGEAVESGGPFGDLVAARVVEHPRDLAVGRSGVDQLPLRAALPGAHIAFDFGFLARLIQSAVVEEKPLLLG